jgi:hypothetical protein
LAFPASGNFVRERLGSQIWAVRPSGSYAVSVLRLLASTTAMGRPQAGLSVVVTVCPSGLVVTVWVTGPPVAGVNAFLVRRPSASRDSMTRPCSSNSPVPVV